MKTEYDKKIEELEQKIQELQQEKEKEQKLAARAAWEAKDLEDKIDETWNMVYKYAKKYTEYEHETYMDDEFFFSRENIQNYARIAVGFEKEKEAQDMERAAQQRTAEEEKK